MKRTKRALTLGNLIRALYEEVAKLTTNRKLQTKLVYLTLMDMQNSRQRKTL
ncbi:hypothetical protein L0222_10095 [bacterium]|nr:hypothetical protein [bacterium]MCI0604615.1 hypothetical protein [bacterium]